MENRIPEEGSRNGSIQKCAGREKVWKIEKPKEEKKARFRTEFCCSIFRDRKEVPETRGCSSAGRAPALQAGGHGFESHHLHQPDGKSGAAMREENERLL